MFDTKTRKIVSKSAFAPALQFSTAIRTAFQTLFKSKPLLYEISGLERFQK